MTEIEASTQIVSLEISWQRNKIFKFVLEANRGNREKSSKSPRNLVASRPPTTDSCGVSTDTRAGLRASSSCKCGILIYYINPQGVAKLTSPDERGVK